MTGASIVVGGPSEVAAVLAKGARLTRLRRLAWVVVAGLAVVAVAVAAYWWVSGRGTPPVTYRTAPAERTSIAVTVSATGTLQPVNQVQVGGETSGIIRAVLVDHNDRVRAGQVLARFDTVRLQAQIERSKAALDAARANVASSQVTLTERQRDFDRTRTLVGGGAARQAELDTARSALDRAQAATDAALAQARLAQADVALAEVEFSKADVVSPIDGIILKRAVEPGQTVVGTLQAPVLFTIAEDLTRLNLLIDVDEADAALVREGQLATFTVEAFPARTFPARVTQVRYLPETQAGVVTYKAMLSVDNSELLLLPGMTATADLAIADYSNVLTVPNAALRFTPPQPEPANTGGLFSFMRPQPSAPAAGDRAAGGQRTVWVLRDGALESVLIRTGVTDGTRTEVLSGDLGEGAAVVLEAIQPRG